MMKNVIVVGAGGHAAELDEYITAASVGQNPLALQVVGFLDDDPVSYERYRLSAPLLGPISTHEVRPDCSYLMAIGSVKARRAIADRLVDQGCVFVGFVHPTAYVSPSATIGAAVTIAPSVTVGPNVTIGDFSLINSRVSIGHDSKLGAFNVVSPNVGFTGFTSVGAENFFGIGSVVLPKVSVGNRNTIAAGMIIDKNVNDDEVVFYRFKERVIAVTK